MSKSATFCLNWKLCCLEPPGESCPLTAPWGLICPPAEWAAFHPPGGPTAHRHNGKLQHGRMMEELESYYLKHHLSLCNVLKDVWRNKACRNLAVAICRRGSVRRFCPFSRRFAGNSFHNYRIKVTEIWSMLLWKRKLGHWYPQNAVQHINKSVVYILSFCMRRSACCRILIKWTWYLMLENDDRVSVTFDQQ